MLTDKYPTRKGDKIYLFEKRLHKLVKEVIEKRINIWQLNTIWNFTPHHNPKTHLHFPIRCKRFCLVPAFAENIGKKLEGNKFKTDLNPIRYAL